MTEIEFVSGRAPKLVVRPPPLTHVQTGATFVLSCKATAEPKATDVTWMKDGQPLTGNTSHIRIFQSGQNMFL